MSATYEAGGVTNLKRQKTEFQKKKTEQMFSFMMNAFKAANESSKESIKQSNNDKKRKAHENFAFDDDVFDDFNMDDIDNEDADE